MASRIQSAADWIGGAFLEVSALVSKSTGYSFYVRLTLQLPALSSGRRPEVSPKLSRRLEILGEVVERLMALGCKPSVLRDYEGSNPSLSTRFNFSERE